MIDHLRCKWSRIDNARRWEFAALHFGRPWHLADLHSYSGDVRFFGVKAPCRKGRIAKDFEKWSKESKSDFNAFCFTMIGCDLRRGYGRCDTAMSASLSYFKAC